MHKNAKLNKILQIIRYTANTRLLVKLNAAKRVLDLITHIHSFMFSIFSFSQRTPHTGISDDLIHLIFFY